MHHYLKRTLASSYREVIDPAGCPLNSVLY